VIIYLFIGCANGLAGWSGTWEDCGDKVDDKDIYVPHECSPKVTLVEEDFNKVDFSQVAV
jgi:hypothetical protein